MTYEVTRVYLDMDGVIANFTDDAARLFCKDKPYERGVKGTWDICKTLNVNPAEFWPALDRSFWAGLSLTPWANALVELLVAKFGVENITILTTPCATQGCYTGKKLWLRQHFPEFERGMLATQEKHGAAHKGALLIDDNDNNCKNFENPPHGHVGGKAVLVPQPWNELWSVKDAYTHVAKELDNYVLKGVF